ncbi:MAG: hypothetical protein O7A63_00845 [Acidobacteria bacterium]|nr:hypothetical protein [Acidobacteriota bacterium]
MRIRIRNPGGMITAACVALVTLPAFAGNKDVLITPTGITYAVWEQRERTFLGDPTSAISALHYSVIKLDTRSEGVVSGTNDEALDTQPRLAFDQSTNEPVMVWSRWDGSNQKIAYSRYSGNQWSSPKMLTFGPGDDTNPRIGAAVDSEFLFWITRGDHHMYAPFDLSTGHLLSPGKPIHFSFSNNSSTTSPEEPGIGTLEGGQDAPILGGSCTRLTNGRCRGGWYGEATQIQEPNNTIQGNTDAPIILINSQAQLWAVASRRGCREQVVAVPANDVQSLAILSFRNGRIILIDLLAVPTPIPDGYGDQAARTFLMSLCD